MKAIWYEKFGPASEVLTPGEAPTPEPAEDTARTAAESVQAPKKGPGSKPDAGGWWWGTGRRKSAVARVRLRPGDGKFIVNKRAHDEYLTEERDQKDFMNVLQRTKTVGSLDVHVNVGGGGYTGQTGAIVLGLGRALLRYDATLEPVLREHGFLSRDPRRVERKKYGQPGARKRFQFSKR